MPYLGRAFIGDGAATMVAALGGGTGVTTYAENIGVMAITRVYSTLLFVIAALLAILLGFSPKFGALVGSIPTGVLGGVGTVLFGLIAVTGARIWVTNQVDFSRGVNLFVAAVVLIVGAADYTLRLGDFELGGIGLGTFGAIILYQLFKRVPGGADAEASTDVVRNEQSTQARSSAAPRRGGGSGRSARRGRRR
jgi:xanthine/uracil permease